MPPTSHMRPAWPLLGCPALGQQLACTVQYPSTCLVYSCCFSGNVNESVQRAVAPLPEPLPAALQGIPLGLPTAGPGSAGLPLLALPASAPTRRAMHGLPVGLPQRLVVRPLQRLESTTPTAACHSWPICRTAAPSRPCTLEKEASRARTADGGKGGQQA